MPSPACCPTVFVDPTTTASMLCCGIVPLGCSLHTKSDGLRGHGSNGWIVDNAKHKIYIIMTLTFSLTLTIAITTIILENKSHTRRHDQHPQGRQSYPPVAVAPVEEHHARVAPHGGRAEAVGPVTEGDVHPGVRLSVQLHVP